MFYFSTGFFAQRKINCPSCVVGVERGVGKSGGGGEGQSEHIK